MPCDYADYPLDWFTRIRPAILTRAGHCCERCGVPNYAILRIPDRKSLRVCRSHAEATTWRLQHFPTLRRREYAYRLATVVLTIAHLDHELLHNDFSNLQALCQRCHNRHDAPVRRAKRIATIAALEELAAPRLSLFPLKRQDVMPSMRNHHAIAPLIDPAS